MAQGRAATFAPGCEVVVHDLMHPRHAILSIHNNLSGRKVGDPATELGLARISDPQFPQLISNYANQFPDGRQAKSTSIGIRDGEFSFQSDIIFPAGRGVKKGGAARPSPPRGRHFRSKGSRWARKW